MTIEDADRLDDVAGLAATDASDMLRTIATSAAQIRASLTAVRETDLARLAPDERPRAIVVTGMGGSGISGDVLAAAVGLGCPVPVVVHRGYGLPGWVGGADLTIAVSCSGTTQETLSAATEAARRGSRLAGIGTAGSPLERICEQARGVFVPITRELSPRSSLWALSVPALVMASRFGLLDLGPDEGDLELAARRLETVAEICGPDRDSFSNPAKRLATELAGSLPMIWGNGQVGAVAATRAAAQLAENAKQPAIVGSLPEAHHNQVVCFDGDLTGDPSGADLFRDRVEEPDPIQLRLVLVRDDADDPDAAARATVSERLADDRGIAVSAIVAEGVPAVERLASLIGVIDYASVYLALMRGIDPTPITAIDELKRLLR
ncbi:MAG TPA: SIS domain-containing protein [Mycobacteriales bacterium]|jgi:glucose/mannose-6-phosphate isomerase|nr:SIS domain-containing protein [Mycobacteriales bacterium]